MPRRLPFALLAVATLAVANSAEAELCADPGAVCTAKLPSSCLQKLGAGSLAAKPNDAQCGPAFQAYQDCLTEAAETCGARPTQSTGVDADLDARAKSAWEAVKDSGDPTELEFVAEAYPNTFWAKLAAKRAAELKQGAATPAPSPRAQPATQARSSLAGGMIADAQEVLKAKCFYYGEVDGVWSSATKRAWRAYQIRAGLRDEPLGPRTLADLRASKATSCVK